MTNNIIYDTLRLEYIESLCELENICFSIPWTKSMFISDVDNEKAYYVLALFQDKVVAYCGLYTVLDEADITNIAVHPDFRHRGLASYLLNRIFDYSKNKSISHITLEVRESNMAAINLYNKFGFKVVGCRKNYYSDNRENAVLMTKEIKKGE